MSIINGVDSYSGCINTTECFLTRHGLHTPTHHQEVLCIVLENRCRVTHVRVVGNPNERMYNTNHSDNRQKMVVKNPNVS